VIFRSVTAIGLFANTIIVFETTQWKPILNWFVKNPLKQNKSDLFSVFYITARIKTLQTDAVTFFWINPIKNFLKLF